MTKSYVYDTFLRLRQETSVKIKFQSMRKVLGTQKKRERCS